MIRHVEVAIEVVRPRDAATFHEWFTVTDLADRHDRGDDGPHWYEAERAVNVQGSDYEWRLLLARDEDGRPVGAAALQLPLLDNLQQGFVEVSVHPGARRRGLGRALLGELEAYAGSRGRTRLLGEVLHALDGSPRPAALFAKAGGYVEQLLEVRRDLPLPMPEETIDALEATTLGRSAGYRLVSYQTAPPEELLEPRAGLAQRISVDAPAGESGLEEERWDVDRVGRTYAEQVAMGRRLWGTMALAPDGSAAGVSELVVSRHDPVRAYQFDTVVERAHRGHRIGLLMKLANQRVFQREWPRARVLHTWNAADNTHMVAINDLMGFRPTELEGLWGKDLG